MLRRRRRPEGRCLEHSTGLRVKFSEVDSLRIVWHGHFIRYFEDGREMFGKQYGIGYMDLLNAGLIAPIVRASCDYFEPAKYGDDLIVNVRLYERESAKIHYYYEITRSDSDTLLASGETIQAFLDLNLDLILTLPDFMKAFYERWKDHMLVSNG
jgi:acyl-CoA thioester hydrolase